MGEGRKLRTAQRPTRLIFPRSSSPFACSTTYLHNPDAHKVVHYCKVCHLDYYHGGTVIMRLNSL